MLNKYMFLKNITEYMDLLGKVGSFIYMTIESKTE
jgi:hypothetical protein